MPDNKEVKIPEVKGSSGMTYDQIIVKDPESDGDTTAVVPPTEVYNRPSEGE